VAEGQAKSRLLMAEAESEAIRRIAEAISPNGMDPAQYLVALKYISAFKEIVGTNDKTVVVPYESSALLGSISTLKEMFGKTKV